MSNGLEKFESGWSDNQFYLTTFTGDEIQDAGFDVLTFGTLNLSTNAYTPALDTFSIPVRFTLPDTGQQLIVYVQTQTGAGVGQTVVNIDYVNQAGALHTSFIGIDEGLPTGRAFFVPMVAGDTGILEIANLTISAGPSRSGIISIRSPRLLIDDFQTNWGPADVGL